MKKIKGIFIIIIVLGIIGGSTYGVIANRERIALLLMPKNKDSMADTFFEEALEGTEPEINVDYIKKKLDVISSLQTAKITYGCMVDFKEGSMKFITKKAFSMFYEATASAGIDVSKITVNEENGKYIVHLPEATMEPPYIDSKSFVFYDKEEGLLKQFDPEDTGKALEYAEQDVFNQATTDQLLDMADKNAVDVITNLLLCFINEEDFEVIKAERSEVKRVKPPITSSEALELNYLELKEKFKKAGFTNIKLSPIEDIKIGLLTKEGEVESITIAGKTSFKKSSIFDANDAVVIKYHTKNSK